MSGRFCTHNMMKAEASDRSLSSKQQSGRKMSGSDVRLELSRNSSSMMNNKISTLTLGTFAEEDEEQGLGMDTNNGIEGGLDRRESFTNNNYNNTNVSMLTLGTYAEGDEEEELYGEYEEPITKEARPKFRKVKSEYSTNTTHRPEPVVLDLSALNSSASDKKPKRARARRATVESAASGASGGDKRSVFGSSDRYNSSSNIGCWEDDINTGEYWMPPENEYNVNEPLVVDFRCACFKLTDVSTVNFTTLVKFVVVFEWYDSRLKGMPITTNDLPADLWGPDIILENAQNDCAVVYDSFSLLNAKQGRLKRTVTFHGHIFTPMLLKDFPFDSEELSLKFISINNWRTLDQTRHGNDPVNHVYVLRPMLDREDVDFFLLGWGGKVQEFNMLGWSQDVKNPEIPSIPIVFKFDIHLVRMASFYVYKVLFPLWLITITSMATFAIDPLDLQGRLEVLFTLLLSTIALLYVVQESIPKISFLTMVDKIVNATLLNLALSVLFSYLISRTSNPAEMNLILAIANQVVYWAVNVFLIMPPYMRFRKKIRDFVKKQEEIDEIRRMGIAAAALVGNDNEQDAGQSVHVAMRKSFAARYLSSESRKGSALSLLPTVKRFNRSSQMMHR